MYPTRVVRRDSIADDTIALTIERPRGFVFEPGQYVTFSVPGLAGSDASREFSLAGSAASHVLVIAMRVRNSEFKHACADLAPGSPVGISEASGCLGENFGVRPEIWIAGGIGVAPLRAILSSARDAGVPAPIRLIHSARSESSAPWFHEFVRMGGTSSFEYVPFVTRRSSGDSVSSVRLQTPDLSNAIARDRARRFRVVGTRDFVANIRGMLDEIGIPREAVMSERFCGYDTKR